jgi:hypothetical protein
MKAILATLTLLFVASTFSFGQNKIYDSNNESQVVFEVDDNQIYSGDYLNERRLVFVRNGSGLYLPNAKKPTVSFANNELFYGAKTSKNRMIFTIQGSDIIDSDGRNAGTIKGNEIVKDGKVLVSSSEAFSNLEMLTTLYYLYYSEGVIASR